VPPDAEAAKTKGGLALDTREGLVKGGTPARLLCPANRPKACSSRRSNATTPPDTAMPPKG